MSGNQASFNGSSEWERFSRVAANPSGGSDGRWKVYALVFLIMLAVYIGLLFWWRKRKTKSCETFSEGETRSNDECIEDNDDACRDDWSDGECGHEHEKPNQTKKEVNADANGTDKVNEKEKEKNKVDDSCDIDSSGTHSGSDSCSDSGSDSGSDTDSDTNFDSSDVYAKRMCTMNAFWRVFNRRATSDEISKYSKLKCEDDINNAVDRIEYGKCTQTVATLIDTVDTTSDLLKKQAVCESDPDSDLDSDSDLKLDNNIETNKKKLPQPRIRGTCKHPTTAPKQPTTDPKHPNTDPNKNLTRKYPSTDHKKNRSKDIPSSVRDPYDGVISAVGNGGCVDAWYSGASYSGSLSPYVPHESAEAGLDDDSVTSRLLRGLRVPPSSNYSCNETGRNRPPVVVLSSGEDGIDSANGFNGITEASIAKCGGSSIVGGFKTYEGGKNKKVGSNTTSNSRKVSRRRDSGHSRNPNNRDASDIDRRNVLMSKLDAISQNVNDVKNVCGEIFN